MKVTKKQSSLMENTVVLSEVEVGVPVFDIKGKRLVMKVKPTGFLLNSNIVADVSQRGDCFICALKEGTVFAAERSRQVILISSELSWNEL